MKNIYNSLEDLARSIRMQNLFVASKEIGGIRLFKNSFDFSKIQEIYLSHLYNFDVINRDIILEKISKHVFDDKVYWDSYLIYKRKNIKKTDKKDKKSDVSLVTGKTIKFPKRQLNEQTKN